MNDAIQVLPPELASQIAAGEVVERPASVVKELVENSLDAGARRIEVSIEGGGITRIEIVDDGRGMDETNARLSVERHATSKLRAFTDLDELVSYGFRGEALPSIASVSRLTLRTRTQDSPEGLELSFLEGHTPSLRPVGTPVGTQVIVSDLFYNVPARRKFLRASATESGHVTDVVESAALSRPDVAFSLKRDGRIVKKWSRASNRAERVHQVLDGSSWISCEGERGPLSISAFLSAPEQARQGAGALHLFLNGRPIKDRSIAGTIAHAYGASLERGRYPRGVVYLEMPPRLVDINVHPQKTEVRFAEPRAVAGALYDLISKSLAELLRERASRPPATLASATPPARPERPTWPSPAEGELPEGSTDALRDPQSSPRAHTSSALHFRDTQTKTRLDFSKVIPIEPESQPAPTKAGRADWPLAGPGPSSTKSSEELHWDGRLRLLGLAHNGLLLCEDARGLSVLEPRATSAALLVARLERLLSEAGTAHLPSAPLLFPLTLELGEAETERLEEHNPELERLGFEVRQRTERAISLHAVPLAFDGLEPEDALRAAIAELGHKDPKERALTRRVLEALARRATESIRLSPSEAEELVASLAELELDDARDRGLLHALSWSELERRGGRA